MLAPDKVYLRAFEKSFIIPVLIIMANAFDVDLNVYKIDINSYKRAIKIQKIQILNSILIKVIFCLDTR